jgi:hypothetical protein
MMIYPAAMVLGTALCARSPGPLRVLLAGGCVLGLAALAAVSVALGLELRTQLSTPLTHARAGVVVDPRHGPVIDDVVSWVEANAPAGTPVPVVPIQPMIDFLAGREGAGGFYVIWPVFQHPERDARIIADLERRRAEIAVYSVSQYAHLGTFRQNAPRLFAYLAEHFTIERVFSREVYGLVFCGLRRRAPADGAPLAIEPAAGEPPVLWPFARVVAQRVGSDASPTTTRIAHVLPSGAPRLKLRYGVNPERWLETPSGPFTFRVAVEPQGAPPETLLEASLDPHRRVADRLWPEVSLDLSRWAAQRITIVLAISGADPPADPSDLAGWSDLRVVER